MMPVFSLRSRLNYSARRGINKRELRTRGRRSKTCAQVLLTRSRYIYYVLRLANGPFVFKLALHSQHSAIIFFLGSLCRTTSFEFSAQVMALTCFAREANVTSNWMLHGETFSKEQVGHSSFTPPCQGALSLLRGLVSADGSCHRLHERASLNRLFHGGRHSLFFSSDLLRCLGNDYRASSFLSGALVRFIIPRSADGESTEVKRTKKKLTTF